MRKYGQNIQVNFKIFLDVTQETQKTENNYHQKPFANRYYIKCDITDVLKSGYHERFGLDNVDFFWENEKLEIKMNYYFHTSEADKPIGVLSKKAVKNIEGATEFWLCE